MNKTIKVCDKRTHEQITNAEHALEAGQITRAERDEIIMSCIASETEWAVLDARITAQAKG